MSGSILSSSFSRWRSGRRLLIGIAVLGVAALCGGMAAGSIAPVAGPAAVRPGGGAAEVAERYASAIAAGDAGTANRLARVEARGEARLLTDEVLAAATRVTDVRVTPLGAGGAARARFAVAYRLGDRAESDRLELRRDGRGWYVSRGLAVRLPAVPGAVSGFLLRGSDGRLDAERPGAL